MSIDVIHEHMNQIMRTKVGTIVTKPILIEPTDNA